MRNVPNRTACCLICLLLPIMYLTADELPVVSTKDVQPLVASSLRLSEALEYLGSALSASDSELLHELARMEHVPSLAEKVQEVLDPYCLAMVQISPEARVKVLQGPVDPVLTRHGWKNYLVKVHNEAGSRARLNVLSPNAQPVLYPSTGRPRPARHNELTPGELAQRFLEIDLYGGAPLSKDLSGAAVEYKVLQLYTKDIGKREAEIRFHIGPGTEDLGFRSAIHVLFDCRPSVKVLFRVMDDDGEPATASFIIRDNVDRQFRQREAVDIRAMRIHNWDPWIERATRRPWFHEGVEAKELVGVYPLPSRRVAMQDEFRDFYFQPQVYRADGEHVYLPAGRYDVTWTRGPEYLPQTRTIEVPAGVTTHTETFQLKRWVHMAGLGWYSADHHVHAGGCSHYESPEAGVTPEAMMRQALGEDLNVASVLSWGPCWYHQKTFFEGETHSLSTPRHLLRYDVEVSGFPSSHAGHLCLLRLREDDYPRTATIEEWPSWTLPILQWGKQQGGLVGYAHSGLGLAPMQPTEDLPNYVMAPFNDIGANEYIVTVTHDAVDFISAGDTPIHWELNIWYHTLNCGFRTNISGETDFPCMFDERVGMARSYARVPGQLSFDRFVEEVDRGSNYVSDGRSHIIEFKVENVEMGLDGGELLLDSPQIVTIRAKVAAYLPEEQDIGGKTIAEEPLHNQPYWHIERARVPGTRRVPVELVQNAYPVAVKEIEADGTWQEVTFSAPVDYSGWFALRILGSVHTNPIYVLVDGKPLRASRRSAEWCRAAVDQCWKMKSPKFRDKEIDNARKAYDHARAVYDRIIQESVAE